VICSSASSQKRAEKEPLAVKRSSASRSGGCTRDEQTLREALLVRVEANDASEIIDPRGRPLSTGQSSET
jgi:hypothetical protein